MSHWLDDAARGLADGRYSRRQVLRRGGTVAGSLVMASVSGSLGGLVLPAVASGAVTCAGRHAPCKAGERCCVGVDVEEVCYHPSIDQCCEENGVKKGVCSRKKECCGHECCDPDNETCCGGRCVSKSSDVVCCRKDAHDPGEACHEGESEDGLPVEKCCHFSGTGYDPREQVCCGSGVGETKSEECCQSGRLSYCAPKGQCCPKGEHRVTCSGDFTTDMCCPEDEYCCGGTCCRPQDCHNGVCGTVACPDDPTHRCPSGKFCCFLPGQSGDCCDYNNGNYACCTCGCGANANKSFCLYGTPTETGQQCDNLCGSC